MILRVIQSRVIPIVTLSLAALFLLTACEAESEFNDDTYSVDLRYQMEPEELNYKERQGLTENLDAGNIVKIFISQLTLLSQKTTEQMNVWNDNYNAIGYRDEKGELWVTIYENKGTQRQEILHARADDIDVLEQELLNEFSHKVLTIIQWCVEFLFKVFEVESEYPEFGGGGPGPAPPEAKWGEAKWGEFEW